MRSYGANKATEFTKKQINVIYAATKRGDLVVDQKVIKEFYLLADYYGYDDNRNVERAEAQILRILKTVFDRDYAAAQELINNYI